MSLEDTVQNFFSRARNILLPASLVLGLGCGGVVYIKAQPPDTKIAGSTEKLQYKTGEEVKLHGPLASPAITKTEAQTEQPKQILLRSRRFIPNYETKVEPGLKEKTAGRPRAERIHALMQHIPDGKEKLQEQGIEFLSYIPNDTWVVSMPVGALDKAGKDPNLITWAGEIQTTDKLSPLLSERKTGRWNTTEEGNTGLIVKFHKDVPIDEGIALIKAHNGEVTGTAEKINSASVNVKSLDDFLEIAKHDPVAWIEFSRPMSTTNYNSRATSRVSELQECWEEYTGGGIVAGVYDGGTACVHEDFDTRLTIGEGETISCAGHATHVTGTVAGSGLMTEHWSSNCLANLAECEQRCEEGCEEEGCDCEAYCDTKRRECQTEDRQFRGIIPSAEIVSYSYPGCKEYCLYNTPGDIEDDYDKLINTYGAHLITNSIGSNAAGNMHDCGINGSTDTTAVLIDTIIAENQTPILYAAGNERGYGRCGTTHDTIGAPAAGLKNGFVIGATDVNDEVTGFTSWGPTDDGRIGVTACMHGKDVMSTYPGNTYMRASGTSMATPGAAGVLGLLTQAHIASHDKRPTASLLKAVIANSAADVGPVGIDYQCGFGRADASSALEHILEGRHVEGELTNKKKQEQYTLKLDEESDLKVTLAWTDIPGDPMAGKQLVNDLDLELVSPDRTVHHPRHLNPEQPEMPASTEKEDHANNIEQIHIENASPGLYTLIVKANKLAEKKQTYSIAHGPAGTLEEALLVNNSKRDFEGYVRMEVYGTNMCGEGEWSKLETVVDDKKTGLPRYLPAKWTLPLYEIWQGNGGFTPTVPGYYRIHAEFLDKNGKVYETKNGPMEKDFFFTVAEHEDLK